MKTVLLHDGRRVGHRKWTIEALTEGVAGGAILNPFATPRIGRPRHPSAAEFAQDVSDAGGMVVFDATTHALSLPSTDRVDLYSTWGLGLEQRSLSTGTALLDHVERVFEVQERLDAPHLIPTLTLTAPDDLTASNVIEMTEAGASIDPGAWGSLAGTRAFWASGHRLDRLIGELSASRLKTWVLTLVNEPPAEPTLGVSDVAAVAGWMRAINSLSLRSQVVVAHSDYVGLLGMAAGAELMGSGWDRSQRCFDPQAYHQDEESGVRIPASYVTQGGLVSVLRRSTAEAVDRLDAGLARRLRGGTMPRTDHEERMHHLRQVAVASLALAELSDRDARAARLRETYLNALDDYGTLIRELGDTVKVSEQRAWVETPLASLDFYAKMEGYWE